MSQSALTRDKVAPLLKKPEAVVLIVRLFSVVAVKITKGIISEISTARGLDQKGNADSALNLLKKSAGKLPKELIVLTHEVALTSVPVSFGADVSWADANQALTWQLNEIISEVFPTPTMHQVVESTNFLDKEKYDRWTAYSANANQIPSIDQALIALDLCSEEDLEQIHSKLEFITPQSLEQLHLGWRPMPGEETAVMPIRKELRQRWILFSKENKLTLKAILPLALPSKKELSGKESHYTHITPAKVSTYYYEKGQLQEVRDFPRQGHLLPESWILGLNQVDEAKQVIHASPRDAALLRRYITDESSPNTPTILDGETSQQTLLENLIHLTTLEPEKRTIPYVSPLEPLPPMSRRRMPYVAGVTAACIALFAGQVVPEYNKLNKLKDSFQQKKLELNQSQSRLSLLRNQQREAESLDKNANRLQKLLDAAFANSSVRVAPGAFSKASHHRNLLDTLAQHMRHDIGLNTFTSNSKGEIRLDGFGATIPAINAFIVPYFGEMNASKMPEHTSQTSEDQANFRFKFKVQPK